MSADQANIVVRRLEPSDLSAVMEITALSYRKEYHESEDAFQRLIAAFPEGNFIVLINDKPVAYCFSHPTIQGNIQPLNDKNLSLSGDEDCYYLHDMCVHPAYQRRGLTRMLFRQVVSVAEERGYEIISLVAVQKSRKFWESKGFVSRKKILYGGLSAHHMEAPLSQAAALHA